MSKSKYPWLHKMTAAAPCSEYSDADHRTMEEAERERRPAAEPDEEGDTWTPMKHSTG